MAKFDLSRFLTNSATQAATEFAKGMDSKTVAAAAFSGLTKVGEQVATQMAKSMAQGASTYVQQKLGTDATAAKLGGMLADTLLKQVQQAATARIQQGGQQVRQQAANYIQAPVGSTKPQPFLQNLLDQDYTTRFAQRQRDEEMRRLKPTNEPPPWAIQPGYDIARDARYKHLYNYTPPAPAARNLEPLPDEGTPEARGRVPYSRQVSSFFSRGGGMHGSGLGSAATFFVADYGIKSLIGGVTSSLQTVNELVQQAGQLQKTIGSTAPAQSFYRNVGSATTGLGYLPQDMLAAASVYMPAARTSSASDITQLARFGNSYGLDPSQWAAQMAQAAGQLGYVGGAQGSMGLSAYQGLLASAYASSSGLAKMPDFTTGWQDLARLMQANTVTSPSPSGPNSALQFYVRLNQSKIAGESGTSAGALLGQLSQGIVNGPTSGSPGVQMAFYSALGGTKGISPAQLQWETEQGLSGPAFKDIISYANRMYAGFSPMDKRYAESKLLGLNMHQTQAVLSAYGNGGAAFSMQGLNSLLKGAGTSLNSINDSQLNLLAQLAGGKSTSVIAQEMAQQHIKGVQGLYVPVNGDTRHMMLNPNVSRQQLADLIVKGGTPESEADKQRKAANALAIQLQIAASKVQDFWRALQNQLASIMQWVNKNIMPPLDKVGETFPIPTAIVGGVATGVGIKEAVKLPGKVYRKFTGAKSTKERLTESESRLARLEGKSLGERQGTGRSYGRNSGLEPPDAYLDDPYAGTGAGAEGAAGIDPLAWPFVVAQQAYDPHSGLNHLLKNFGIWSGGTGGVPPAYRVMPGGYGLPTTPGGGSAILDSQTSQRLGQDAQSYRAVLGGFYHSHLKAANKANEALIGKILNTNAPLDSNTLRTLDDDLSTFVKQFGKGLTSWVQASLTAVTGMSGFGSGSGSGSGSGGGKGTSGYGAWSASASGGVGSNTFAGFGQGAKWGQKINVILPNGMQDTERGAIFTGTTGQAIRLPQAARYDANLSDQYRSIFTLPNGEALSFMHGNMSQSFKNGQTLAAGTVIGRVAPNSGTYYGTTPTGNRNGYVSSPDIVEFGVYDNAHDAYKRNVALGTQSLNPYAYLASLGKGSSSSMGSGAGAGAGGGAYPSYFSLVKNGQTAYLRNPQLIKDYVNAARKYGLDPRALVAQGFQESGWNPKITNTTQGVRDAYGVEYAQGIAQFLPSTARSFGINPFNPDQAIMAQAKYMAQLGAGSNLQQAWASYGTGDISNLYASTRMGPVPGGGSAPMGGRSPLRITIDPLDINIKNADGSKQTIRVQPRVKFAGITGVHTEPMPTQHGTVAHPASKAAIKR